MRDASDMLGPCLAVRPWGYTVDTVESNTVRYLT